MAIHIQSGNYTATIVKPGAGLAGLQYRGRDLVLPHSATEKARGYSGKVLVPWPNRVTDATYIWRGQTLTLDVNEAVSGAALHGLLAWEPWQVSEQSDDEATLTATVQGAAGYPFHLLFSTTYRLHAEGGLTVTIESTNLGDEDAPLGVGIHPYLTCGIPVDECELTMPGSSPTLIGPTQIDDAYAVDGPWSVTLRDPRTGRGAQMSAETPWVQVYSGEELDRRGVAVEPMSCPPNAFNTGEDLVILSAGQTHLFQARIEAV